VDPRLATVWWIGGSPCAGKTSLARLLAARYGLGTYHCDDGYAGRQARANGEGQPRLHALQTATCDEIWLGEVGTMVADELQAYGEELPMIVEELVTLGGGPLLVEGTALLPERVAALLGGRRRAIWVVPTEEFQRRHYAQRAWTAEVVSGCSDPGRAWANWMARDAAFARRVADQAAALGLPVLWVDGRRTLERTAQVVAAWLGLAQARALGRAADGP